MHSRSDARDKAERMREARLVACARQSRANALEKAGRMRNA
jgi:hypothetical protein